MYVSIIIININIDSINIIYDEAEQFLSVWLGGIETFQISFLNHCSVSYFFIFILAEYITKDR